MNDPVGHLASCVRRAPALGSKLSLATDLPDIPGMSGKMGRDLLNNICAVDDVRYLEVGMWQGSTLRAALWENKVKAVGIDNWSEYSGPRDFFWQMLPTYLGENDLSVGEGDCFEFFTDDRFDVFFYDGAHSEYDQYRAIVHFVPMMDREFILLVDDFKSPEVQLGTKRAIKDLRLTVLSEHLLGFENGNHTDTEGYWNGMLAAVVSR